MNFWNPLRKMRPLMRITHEDQRNSKQFPVTPSAGGCSAFWPCGVRIGHLVGRRRATRAARGSPRVFHFGQRGGCRLQVDVVAAQEGKLRTKAQSGRQRRRWKCSVQHCLGFLAVWLVMSAISSHSGRVHTGNQRSVSCADAPVFGGHGHDFTLVLCAVWTIVFRLGSFTKKEKALWRAAIQEAQDNEKAVDEFEPEKKERDLTTLPTLPISLTTSTASDEYGCGLRQSCLAWRGFWPLSPPAALALGRCPESSTACSSSLAPDTACMQAGCSLPLVCPARLPYAPSRSRMAFCRRPSPLLRTGRTTSTTSIRRLTCPLSFARWGR